jgi:hypothetical protein
VNNNETGPLATKLYDELTGLQSGLRPDTHHWLFKV